VAQYTAQSTFNSAFAAAFVKMGKMGATWGAYTR